MSAAPLMLFCDRVPAQSVDFARTRFVVGKSCGMNVAGVHLGIGDEVPAGALSERALRECYEPPLALIETLDRALADPQLRAHVAERSPSLLFADGGLAPEGVPFVVGEATSEQTVPRGSLFKKKRR